MRYKLYTFMGGWLSTPGGNIKRYFRLPESYPLDQLMKRPKESMGDTGAFILYDDNTPLILAPETSIMYNYDFVQYMSPIRSLARKMPVERQQLSELDEQLLRQASVAFFKLDNRLKNK